jgi:hypothetical protein
MALCLMAGLFLLLSGCFFKSTEELYAVPQASEEYINLKAAIDAVKGTADYAAPTSGKNTQTVQLVDLDDDGVQEAITFLRDASAEKPLKIYIFSQTGDENYKVKTVIEGDGTAIESVYYCNLGGSTAKEIIVSWRMSTSVRTLVAYGVDGETVTELMRTGYSYYVPADIDKDNACELLLLQVDTENNSIVEYYDYHKGAMALRSSAGLSEGITEVRAYRAGNLKDNVPALFVTSEYGDKGVITDIFSVSNEEIRNITLDQKTGRSSETLRFYTSVEAADINQDGVLELPQPQSIRSYSKSTAADDFWIITWRQYDSSGVAWPVCTTYHNYNTYDRWYLILPDDWVGQFTLARGDTNTATGERAVVFSYWPGDEKTEPQPFLTIYKLTGTNRVSRSKLGNRFILKTESDAIYAAEFIKCDWNCGLTEEGLRARFDLIRTDWSADD